MTVPEVDTVKIESLGVYLPEKVVTTAELMASCHHRLRLNLEEVTGIRERRVAVGEFAQDLAVKAAKRALALSRYAAEDLDVVISTSISKHHRQDEFNLEPATAVLIRKAIGARRALTFDVVNACAGMFNGIWVLRGLIRSGAARCGMVVSGEHNMPLAESATREVRHSLDRQLAALTLGDCGAAVILDGAEDHRYGFHWLDLVTGAKHDHYCHSRPSSRGRGGVLLTRASGLQRKGAEHFPFYLKQAVDGTGWSMDDIHHVIPHQVSVRAIRQGVHALGRIMGCELPDYFRCSVDRFGNTTTTSHFLVLHEFILSNLIQPEHNLLFVSGASGIVITHATYTLDDLPERYRAHWQGERGVVRRCRVESLGVSLDKPHWGSVRHAVEAGRHCLRASCYHPADVRVLVNTGVHRDGHVCEPAIAAYIQRRLGINVEFQGRRTLAFDLANGGCGMLNAVHVLAALMASGEIQVGMVVASEANSDRLPDPAYTYPRSGAAVLLDLSPRSQVGFGAFAFHTNEEHSDLYTSIVSLGEKHGRLLLRRRAELEDAYLAAVGAVVDEVLARDGLRREEVDLVVPAQISASFLGRLPAALGLPADRVLDLSDLLPDTLTTSVFLAFHHARGSGRLRPGARVVLLACGSGVTVGAATYQL